MAVSHPVELKKLRKPSPESVSDLVSADEVEGRDCCCDSAGRGNVVDITRDCLANVCGRAVRYAFDLRPADRRHRDDAAAGVMNTILEPGGGRSEGMYRDGIVREGKARIGSSTNNCCLWSADARSLFYFLA